ncbi:hypothetical protein CY35_03G130400 [Sphagnum magellanicum]|jgi:hypothetical protein|nr:hypothetical protein CY35_03G130400 [Sphagnum magellanicum]
MLSLSVSLCLCVCVPHIPSLTQDAVDDAHCTAPGSSALLMLLLLHTITVCAQAQNPYLHDCSVDNTTTRKQKKKDDDNNNKSKAYEQIPTCTADIKCLQRKYKTMISSKSMQQRQQKGSTTKSTKGRKKEPSPLLASLPP